MRVSTRMVLPASTKDGTCTCKPVSVITFLFTPVAVSTADGSICLGNQQVNRSWQLYVNRLDVIISQLDFEPLFQVLGALAQHIGGQGWLLEVSRSMK